MSHLKLYFFAASIHAWIKVPILISNYSKNKIMGDLQIMKYGITWMSIKEHFKNHVLT